jgi:hypothetical protein
MTALSDPEPDEIGPPGTCLALAGAAVSAALVLALFAGLSTHVAGYVLGSFICIGLTMLFRKMDAHRRGSDRFVYIETMWLRPVWSTVLFLGVAVSGWHAWAIATLLAQR